MIPLTPDQVTDQLNELQLLHCRYKSNLDNLTRLTLENYELNHDEIDRLITENERLTHAITEIKALLSKSMEALLGLITTIPMQSSGRR